MGEAMRIKAEEVDGEGQVVKKEEEGEAYDYRAESKFSEHLKNIKNEVSAFLWRMAMLYRKNL